MTIVKHEIKMNLKSLLIWSISIGLLSFSFMLLYPNLKTTLSEMSNSYQNMGGFSAAFGMDKLNIGELMGFYGTEIGAIYILGSSLFAALLGIGILSKEEGNHTSEFLYTLPISRQRVITEKLIAMIVLILSLNFIFILLMLLSFLIINEPFDYTGFLLYHLSGVIMNIQIASICFAFSSYARKNNAGTGLSVALLLYFLDMMSKVVEETKLFKYISPFSYADAANVLTSKTIDIKLLIPGISITIFSIFIGYLKYSRKDLAS